MDEHLKLRAICDIIKYSPECGWVLDAYGVTEGYSNGAINDGGYSEDWIDVREIIFTQEFKEKFDNYCKSKKELCVYTMDGVLDHLDDPVSYLYNLLGLGEKYSFELGIKRA